MLRSKSPTEQISLADNLNLAGQLLITSPQIVAPLQPDQVKSPPGDCLIGASPILDDRTNRAVQNTSNPPAVDAVDVLEQLKFFEQVIPEKIQRDIEKPLISL